MIPHHRKHSNQDTVRWSAEHLDLLTHRWREFISCTSSANLCAVYGTYIRHKKSSVIWLQSKLSILSFELWKSAAPAPGPQHGHGNFVEKESFGTDEAKPSEIRWNVLDLKRPSCHFVWYEMFESGTWQKHTKACFIRHWYGCKSRTQ